jgi:hypothetical protein
VKEGGKGWKDGWRKEERVERKEEEGRKAKEKGRKEKKGGDIKGRERKCTLNMV